MKKTDELASSPPSVVRMVAGSEAYSSIESVSASAVEPSVTPRKTQTNWKRKRRPKPSRLCSPSEPKPCVPATMWHSSGSSARKRSSASVGRKAVRKACASPPMASRKPSIPGTESRRLSISRNVETIPMGNA